MNIYMLTAKCYIVSDISKDSSLEAICNLLDKTLIKDKDYLDFHKKKCFKNYCFNDFYPIEPDKIYKADNIYSFQLRTVDSNLAIYLSNELSKASSEKIKVLKVDLKVIKPKHIDKLYSISTLVLKDDIGYWKGNLSIEEFENRLRINLIKKYNYFTGEKINEEFPLFTAIEFKNKKPIGVNYKSIKILGDKVSLRIADDSTSQKIAHFAIGVGLGEMNARGFGYVNYRWL